MRDRLREWLSREQTRARLLRWFWVISLLMLLLGYAIILMRLM